MGRIERLRLRWLRLFARRQPEPWERRAVARLLFDVSRDAYACQMVADMLEIECDPGESVADYVSQMLRQPHRDQISSWNEREIARIDRGLTP